MYTELISNINKSLYFCFYRPVLIFFLFVARAFISGAFQAAYVYTPEVLLNSSINIKYKRAVFLAYLVQDTILDIFATLCPSSSSSVIIFSVEIFVPYGETFLQECFFGRSRQNLWFWSQFKIQYGYKNNWYNLIGWTFKLCCSKTTKVVWNLIVVNDPGVLFYKECYFSADQKSKMVASARHIV